MATFIRKMNGKRIHVFGNFEAWKAAAEAKGLFIEAMDVLLEGYFVASNRNGAIITSTAGEFGGCMLSTMSEPVQNWLEA